MEQMKITRKSSREYKQNILLTETENLPKVKFFLDSLESEATRRIYRIGLAYVETFLTIYQERQSGHNNKTNARQ